MLSFDLTYFLLKYLGNWYTYASNYSPEGITCQRVQYGIHGILPDGTFSVQNTVTYADGICNNLSP